MRDKVFMLKPDSGLVEHIGEPAMYEQLAEECVELSHAALKLARYLRGENKVHGHTEEDLRDHLCEEFADLIVCSQEIDRANLVDVDRVEEWINKKILRMRERFAEEEAR